MSHFQRTKIDNSSGTTIDPATSGKQDTGNNSLSSIDSKVTVTKGAGNSDATTVRVVTAADGPLNTSNASIDAKMTNGNQRVIIANASDIAAIITGANTGVKGLRVFGGPTDPISDVPVHIDYDHHQNHEGEAWQYYYYNASLNGTVDFRLTTGAHTPSVWAPHIKFELISDTTSNLYLFEAPVVNAAGTAVTSIFCRNRNKVGSPGMAIRTGATFTSTGTEIYHMLTLSGTKATTAQDNNTLEWILKPSTEYLVRLITTSSSIVLLRMNWYEDLGV